MNDRYTTLNDAICMAVKPLCGDFANDFDLYGIATEMFDYQGGYFVERKNVDWIEVLQRYDKTKD